MATEEGRFTTYLLNLEEVWYIRDNPSLSVCRRVVKAVAELEELERMVEERRASFDAMVEKMNKRRNSSGWGNAR